MAKLTKRSSERSSFDLFDPFRLLFGDRGELEPSQGMFVPDVEVKETADGFELTADVPGIKHEDMDVNVVGNRLTLCGKREAEQRRDEDRYFAYERSYGSFTRSFVLPESADADHIEAELDNGVLHVHIPKHAEKESRKIKVGEAASKPMTEKSTQPGLGAGAKEEKPQSTGESEGVKDIPVEQKVASGGSRR